MADLFASIEKKKSEGSLAPFDPAGHYIHPLSRVKLTIRLSSNQSTRSIKSDSIPGSEDEDYISSEEEDDQEDEYRITRTRSKRPARAKPGGLPFSPRKKRARKLWAIRDSDSSLTGEDSDDPPLPVRRSMRSRKTTEIELDSDSDYDTQKDTPRRIRLLGPKKKVSRPRSVMPSLGRVRDISTIDEDPFDNDDEKEILRLHRRVCEKCHEGPAHNLLASLKKKSKGKGKKRKRSTDDEFEWSNDEEKLTSLGGWVQWFVFSPFLFTYGSKRSVSASNVPLPLTGIVWQVLRKTKS